MVGVLISALAALWLFTAINLPSSPPPLSWARWLLVRLPRGRKLTGCPWCLGGWLAIAAYTAYAASEGSLDAVQTPLGALAAAGLVGLAGGILPTDDEPTED